MSQALIVCSNQSSLPEVLQEVAYILIHNYIDLFSKIDLLIEDSTLRRSISKKALEISKHYSWKKI